MLGQPFVIQNTHVCDLVLHAYTCNHMLTFAFNACNTRIRRVSHAFNVELSAGLYHSQKNSHRGSNF